MNGLRKLCFGKKMINFSIKWLILCFFYSFLFGCNISFSEPSVKYLKAIDEVMSEIECGGNLTYGVLALKSGAIHKIRANAPDLLSHVDLSNFDDTTCMDILSLTTRALFPSMSMNMNIQTDNHEELIHYIGIVELAHLINFLYDKQDRVQLSDETPFDLIKIWNNIITGISIIKMNRDHKVADDIFYLINQVILACAWKNIRSIENIANFLNNLHDDFKNGKAYNPFSVWTSKDIQFLKKANNVRYYAQYIAVIERLENDSRRNAAIESETTTKTLSFEMLIYELIKILTTTIGYDAPEARMPKLNTKNNEFRKVEKFFNNYRPISRAHQDIKKSIEEKWPYFLQSICNTNQHNTDILYPSVENLHKVFALILGKQVNEESLYDLIEILAGNTKKIISSIREDVIHIKIFDTDTNKKNLIIVRINNQTCSLINCESNFYYVEKKQNILDTTTGISSIINHILGTCNFKNHPIWTLLFWQNDTFIKKVYLLKYILNKTETVFLPYFVSNLINSIDWEIYNAEIRRIDAAETFNSIIESPYWQDERFLSNLKTWHIDCYFNKNKEELLRKLPNLERLSLRQWDNLQNLKPLAHLTHLKLLSLSFCNELESFEGLYSMQQIHFTTCFCQKLDKPTKSIKPIYKPNINGLGLLCSV